MFVTGATAEREDGVGRGGRLLPREAVVAMALMLHEAAII